MASFETRMNMDREKEEVIANGVKMRALMQKLSPSIRIPSSSSPASRHLHNLYAHDYPVFTPSYADEPVPAFHRKNLTSSENLDESCVGGEDQDLRHTLRSQTLHFRSVSSCNDYKQRGFDTKSFKNSNLVVPLTDSHSAAVTSQPRNSGNRVLSWLFPKLKRKKKSDSIFNSPSRTERSEEVPEKLKRELMEANRSRDAALTQVEEMKSSLGEFSEKLQYLESYCDGLKKALRQATEVVSQENSNKAVKKTNSEMPMSEEVMVEGFLQIVSESRLSIKQFLKTLVTEIDEEDTTLMSNINTLLQPYNLSFTSKYSKIIQSHLESIISQTIYQDFENCVFQKNGKPKLLDPEQERQAKFSSFASLRNLSWNEVLKKGTKYYSEEFSSFCDEKMSLIITTLKWTRPWSEEMLQAFFVAAKCVWLLHLLAFSFRPALGILRVEENRVFESSYMEDMGGGDRERIQRSSASRGQGRVKVMVMPGFYIQDRVLRCKVLCRYKSLG